MVEADPPGPAEILAALEATFTTRNTHPLPATLPLPPEGWKEEVAAMAIETRLSTTDYLECHALLERFWATLGAGFRV